MTYVVDSFLMKIYYIVLVTDIGSRWGMPVNDANCCALITVRPSKSKSSVKFYNERANHIYLGVLKYQIQVRIK